MTATDIATTGNSCGGFDAAALDEIRRLAISYDKAGGLFMKIVTWAGQATESLVDRLPAGWRARLDEAGHAALKQAYAIAFESQPEDGSARLKHRALSWTKGERWHRVAAGVSGALGGLGGIATTLVDLPVTTTLILRSIQQVAADHGEDLSTPEGRAQCIAVFALGGPLPEDDAGDASLFAARIGLSGKAIAETLKAALPRFGIVVSQKTLAQATPLLGAAAGAMVNPVFTRYYQTMAHVHFGLRRLERAHDPDQVRACFERIVQGLRKDDAEALAATARRRVGRRQTGQG